MTYGQWLIVLNSMMPLPYCVYVLFSEKDYLLYTGFSSNIEKRLVNHNSGGTKSTQYRTPLILIFCEFYCYKTDAMNREKYLKTSAGKRALKIMLRNTLITKGYEPLRIGFGN